MVGPGKGTIIVGSIFEEFFDRALSVGRDTISVDEFFRSFFFQAFVIGPGKTIVG